MTFAHRPGNVEWRGRCSGAPPSCGKIRTPMVDSGLTHPAIAAVPAIAGTRTALRFPREFPVIRTAAHG